MSPMLESRRDRHPFASFSSIEQDQLLQFTQKLMPMEHRDPKRQRFLAEEEPVRLSPRSSIMRLFACGMEPQVSNAAPYRQPQHTLDVGVSSLQGHRPYQEDTYALMSTPRLSMVAVYDGHGGAVTSTALRDCLLPALRDALEPLLDHPGCGVRQVCAALRETFLRVNAVLCTGDQNVVTDGSTAAVLVLCSVQGRMLAFSANAGDSRITLGAVAPMTTTSSSSSSLPTHGCAGVTKPPPSALSPRFYMQQLSSSSSSAASDCSSNDGDLDTCPRPDSADAAAGSSSKEGSPPPHLLSLSGAATTSVGPPTPTPFALRLSRDHDLKSNQEEVERIRAAGGLLVRFQKGGPLRVLSHAGGLNMSRSFGDAAYHGLVIAEPFISVTAIAEPVEFIIVASDGLWTVMEDEEAVAYVHTLFKYQAANKSLATAATTAPAGTCGPATTGGEAAVAGFSTQQAAVLLQREAARRWAARCPGQQDNTTVALVRICWPWTAV